uniref:Uncharacterized LOC100182367 n=1 Tax=Ciona intestinalis TaxID=7719 RepID=F6PK89_CIOIN|nr:uncharacterized protein LOC100182367 [Ciona intestinalis]|eukprot:XP_002129415.1 uncharacterized protein LOC100182367 [Ciona intestinalis]
MLSFVIILIIGVIIADCGPTIQPTHFAGEIGSETSFAINCWSTKPCSSCDDVNITKNDTNVRNYYVIATGTNGTIIVHFTKLSILDCGEYRFAFNICSSHASLQYVTIACNNPPLLPIKYLYLVISGGVCFVVIIASICIVCLQRKNISKVSKTSKKNVYASRPENDKPRPRPVGVETNNIPMQQQGGGYLRPNVSSPQYAAPPAEQTPPLSPRTTSLMTSSHGAQPNQFNPGNDQRTLGAGRQQMGAYDDVAVTTVPNYSGSTPQPNYMNASAVTQWQESEFDLYD